MHRHVAVLKAVPRLPLHVTALPGSSVHRHVTMVVAVLGLREEMIKPLDISISMHVHVIVVLMLMRQHVVTMHLQAITLLCICMHGHVAVMMDVGMLQVLINVVLRLCVILQQQPAPWPLQVIFHEQPAPWAVHVTTTCCITFLRLQVPARLLLSHYTTIRMQLLVAAAAGVRWVGNMLLRADAQRHKRLAVRLVLLLVRVQVLLVLLSVQLLLVQVGMCVPLLCMQVLPGSKRQLRCLVNVLLLVHISRGLLKPPRHLGILQRCCCRGLLRLLLLHCSCCRLRGWCTVTDLLATAGCHPALGVWCMCCVACHIVRQGL